MKGTEQKGTLTNGIKRLFFTPNCQNCKKDKPSKKFKNISYLTVSADLHKILAPEESLLLTGESSSHVLKKHSF